MTDAPPPPVEGDALAKATPSAFRSLEKTTRALILWVAVFLAVAFSSVGALTYFRLTQLEGIPIHGGVNAGFQARAEFLTFRLRLTEAVLSGSPDRRAAAEQAYEVLLSRILSVDSTKNLRLPTREDHLLLQFKSLSDNIFSWEAPLRRYLAGDEAAGREVLQAAGDLTIPFSQFMTGMNDYAYVWFLNNSRLMNDLFVTLVALTLGSGIVLGALIWRLTVGAREARLAQRNLADALVELSAAKAAVEEASSVKSRFLANVSHELRTPLNAIIGFSQLLLEKSLGEKTEAKRDEYLRYVAISGEHLLSLINNLLDLSKIQHGEWEFQPTVIALPQKLREMAQLVAPAASMKSLALAIDCDRAPPSMVADERALRQILLNLLSNAVKFSPEGGEVRMIAAVDPTGGWLVLEVLDQGKGVDEDFLPEIGSPFAQGRPAALSGEEGTGLGLAITTELLARQGGDFRIENRAEGGARAVARLPLSRVEQSDAA
ncbi:MAG: sensor histidine kinase [Elsteraceae bacterium]